MKKRDLTPELILAVACPTCGVPVGTKCRLHAGGQRIEAHIDRKLLAIEALETGANLDYLLKMLEQT